MCLRRLHDYGLRNDLCNKVGVAYMLIDELPGTPLLLKEPSNGQLRKVYDKWAGILCVLQTHPFDKIGSLCFQPNGEISLSYGHVFADGTIP